MLAPDGMAVRKRPALSSGEDLPPFADDGKILHAIVDTPKGSRNKFKWDEERKLYKLSGVLPAGAVFPFDFGYVPSTKGDDGDALDVLLLMMRPICAYTSRSYLRSINPMKAPSTATGTDNRTENGRDQLS